MANRWDGDNQFKDYTISRVEGAAAAGEAQPGGWFITVEEGFGCYCPWVEGIEPKVGSTLRQHGRGFGFPFRSIFIDGQCVFYKTEVEQDAERKASIEAKHEKYEKDKPELDRRVAALPECFRKRIAKFTANNPDFGWNYLGYELFTCEQAVVFADTFKTDKALRQWASLTDYKLQREQCPGMSDQHSGNTFGCAVQLAHWYLTNPEGVVKMHGALAPLVGSEEYGCVAKT